MSRESSSGGEFHLLRSSVIERGLCVRCGACMGVCPSGSLSPDDRSYPVLTGPCSGCGLCSAVCPGALVDFPLIHRGLFGSEYDPLGLHGSHQNLYLGWAAAEEIRRAGASGGVITGLLAHHLRTGRIKGAVVCVPDPSAPYRSMALLAETEAELVQGAQSKLTFVPVLRLLGRLRGGRGRYALVGLPCQVHALRKLEKAAPDLFAGIGLIVGLYCHFNLETEAVADLVECRRIHPGDVGRIEYRGGEWPGGIRAVLRDGRVEPLHRMGYKEVVTILLRLYSPGRCHLCIDPSNEFADLAVGDVWAMDYRGEWAVEKSSLITQRTARGREALEAARDEGALVLKDLPREQFSRRHLSFFREKKENAFIRLSRGMRRGLPTPDYGFPIPALPWSRRLSERFYDVSLRPGRNPVLRRRILGFCLSGPGYLLVRLNAFRKRLFKDFIHP